MTSLSLEAPEDRFPGLREHLAAKFGPDRPLRADEPLVTTPGVKGGGYGVPQLVHWRSADGEHRYVLESARPGGVGHEDRAAALA